MVPFHLTVLGRPELRAPDGDPVRFRTRKHFALLIYLVIEPSVTHRRDRLAGLLWPRSDVEEGRHSLATALSLLRGRLGAEAFDATVARSGSCPARRHRSCRAGAARRRRSRRAGVGAAARRLRHRRLTRFPPLEGRSAGPVDAAAAWHAGRPDWLLPPPWRLATMEALAQRLLRIDPLSEEAARAAARGSRHRRRSDRALRLFDRWRLRLADELGAMPRRRSQGWPSACVAAAGSLHPGQRRPGADRPGRNAPSSGGDGLRGLLRGLGARADGEPSHVLLRGDSGIGKTTLVDRLVTRSRSMARPWPG